MERVEVVVSYLFRGAVKMIAFYVSEYRGKIGDKVVSAKLAETLDNVVAEGGCVGAVAMNVRFVGEDSGNVRSEIVGEALLVFLVSETDKRLNGLLAGDVNVGVAACPVG